MSTPIQGMFYTASGQPIPTDDLQSLIELQYVLVGNTQVADNLASLSSALNITTNIVNTLTSLQNLHNEISVPSAGILENVGKSFQGSILNSGLNYPLLYSDMSSALVQAVAYYNSGPLNAILSASGLTKQGITAQDVADQFFGSAVYLGDKNAGGTLISLQKAEQDSISNSEGGDLKATAGNENTYFEGLYSPHSAAVIDYLRDVQYHTGTVTTGTAFNMTIDGPTQPNGTVNQGTGFATRYAAAASAFFGSPINPVVASQLASTVAQISAIDQMRTLKTELLSEMKSLAATGSGGQGPQSILGTLSAIYNGIPSAMVSGTTSGTMAQYGLFANWILDNYNLGTNPSSISLVGQIQNNITDGITAAQNLNNTQQENVRNYMFEFQEFYQSASTVLQTLNTIITTMAQKLSSS
jgi:hypothetical protein